MSMELTGQPTVSLIIYLSLFSSVKINKVLSNDIVENLIPENYVIIRSQTEDSIMLIWQIAPMLLSTISVKNMEFSVDMNIIAHWFDKKLNISEGSSAIIPKNVASKLWYPWIHFLNCKGCAQTIIDYNKNNFEIYKDGIYVELRTVVIFSCSFDLHYYPFDEQTCEMKVRLSKWNANITLNQTEEIQEHNQKHKKELILPADYTLLDINIVTTSIAETEILFTYIYKFKRIYISQLLLIFLPSILIVVLSWISFWLDVSASAPRVALGLTSLLTLSTQFNSAQKDLPSMATIKAIDVWMFSCMFMVFGSLIEFAMAYSCNSLVSKEVSPVTAFSKRADGQNTLRKIRGFCEKVNGIICEHKNVTNNTTIDDISKVLFPLSFLIFNITYWNYYL